MIRIGRVRSFREPITPRAMLSCGSLKTDIVRTRGRIDLFACLKRRRAVALLVGILLLAAFALRVGIAERTESVDWPDEIFQTREPAHHLAYGNWVRTWEYRVGARSWVFPAVLSVVMRLSDWVVPGSRGYLLGIEIFLSLLSLSTVIFGALFAYRSGGWPAAVMAGVGCAFWYELVYYAPKALAEVVAGNLLLPALYLGAYAEERGRVNRTRLAVACLLCGTVVSLRVQSAPAVLVAIAWFCWRRWRETLPVALVCVALPFLAFGVVDAFTWSYPFQSFIQNIRLNASGVATRFGTEPAYWYIFQLVRHFGLLLPLAVLGVTRLPFLGWIALAFLIPHSLIAHKEYRFLTPILAIVVILAAIGLAQLCGWINDRLQRPQTKILVLASGCALLALLSVQMAWIFPRWRHGSAGNLLLRDLSVDESLCGLGIVQDPWYEEAQYTYLHRNVPIYVVPRATDLPQAQPSFNVILSSAHLNAGDAGFERMKCVGVTCLYRRPGGCVSDPQFEIDTFLKRTNQ
jgi:GPI mannosyltransferase 3